MINIWLILCHHKEGLFILLHNIPKSCNVFGEASVDLSSKNKNQIKKLYKCAMTLFRYSMNTLVGVFLKKLKSYQLQMRQKKSEINMMLYSSGIFYDT